MPWRRAALNGVGSADLVPPLTLECLSPRGIVLEAVEFGPGTAAENVAAGVGKFLDRHGGIEYQRVRLKDGSGLEAEYVWLPEEKIREIRDGRRRPG